MTKSEAVSLEYSKEIPGLAIVQISRPEARNAFNDDVIEGLMDAALSLRKDTSVQVVILSGKGGFFSAGADISTFSKIEGETDINRVRQWAYEGSRLCREWEELPQLTIAAIEGGAVGGGLGIAVSCDWRIMASDAWVYVPEVKLGLNFGWSTLPRLNNLIGPARTKTLSILCRRHMATECESWGLADAISAPGEALEKAQNLAEEALQVPRLPVRIIKRAVNTNANALNASTSYADMDEMLVCMTDQEGNAARGATVGKTAKGK
ncbi:enoyl-CoA hydratase/isomerase family protein [Sneathiella litorea]|uniref:Enoyl-CoA hydratase/isomerase family protein n=1 Tax=Sneathiella litorea TaxID=2606216 RepID=A0A6L8W8X1_9PROT|nr:enoyl-CoA hydratase/isomerase family protein [Sneathiella litorea]MZR30677.1 enoyl-CoA hydratase/isomerase family protein [Sneathiella litorea]